VTSTCRTNRLQDVSSKTNKGRKASTRSSTVGSTRECRGHRDRARRSAGRSRLGRDRGDHGYGGVVIGSRAGDNHGCRGNACSALGHSGGDHRLGDSARAIGDCQGGGRGDGVGRAAVGDGGRARAVRRVGGHNLGGVGDIRVGLRTSEDGGSSDGSGELHCGGIRLFTFGINGKAEKRASWKIAG